MLYYENHNLDSSYSPVKVNEYKKLLMDSNYDEAETAFLVKGFTEGFSIGYQGNKKVRLTDPNLKFRGVGNETVLWNKVMKEVKASRYAGPYDEPPFEYFIQSPIGLVPKDNGKQTRLIFHLSYPRNGSNSSVNANTPRHLCSVKYPDFSKVVQLCLDEGVNCHISRSDMQSAFRNLGILVADFCWLVMKAKNPLTGKFSWFVDKNLPFGSSISCSHFQRFSNSIAHLVTWRTGKDLVNYLDDYLFAALIKAVCDGQVKVFLDICDIINFPVNLDKTYWGTTLLTFLGMLIDTVNQMVLIPMEKVDTARKLIGLVLNNPSKKVTLLQLQKICGFLNFLCRCVVPGRAFTRRLYAYTGTKEGKLKPHHHIKVNQEMREDLKMWLNFLNNSAVYCRPFIDFKKTWDAEEIDLYTDASGKIGSGGHCNDEYFHAIWDREFLKMKPSIEYLELHAVVTAVLIWIHKFRNRRIILFCDNKSVVDMINSNSSSCRNCMVFIRILVMKGLVENVRIFAEHLSSAANKLADLLSRDRVQDYKFLKMERGEKVARTATEMPEQIWPINKIWLY